MDVGVDFLVWAWDPVEAAGSYEAHAFPAGTPPSERPPLLVTVEPTFRADGLQPGIVMTIFVRAVRETAGGRAVGPWSDPGTGTTLRPPAAPTGLMVSATTSDSITWTWNAVEGATAYAVQVSRNAIFGDEDDVTMLTLMPVHTVLSLEPETSVSLRVAAAVGTSLENVVLSDWTTQVTGMSAIPPPSTPTGLMVSATTPDSVTWTWNAVEGATAYAVQVSRNAVFGDEDDVTTLTLMPAHTVLNLEPETSVSLRVAAAVGTSLENAVLSDWTTQVMGMSSAIPLTVSFVENPLLVAEGETVEIALRYDVRQLAAPLQLAVSPVELTATAADYELSARTFEIPAGQDVMGTVTLAFSALRDRWISEGEEVMSLSLVSPAGIRATLDRDIEITIADGAVSPCDGLELRGAPIVPDHRLRHPLETTTLYVSHRMGRSPVWLDWEGPYRHRNRGASVLNINIAGWRVTTGQGTVTHALDVEWFEGELTHLVVRSPGGDCRPETSLACSGAGCELQSR